MGQSVFITVCPHPVLGQKALADAGVPYSAIEQACVGYVYGKKKICTSFNPG